MKPIRRSLVVLCLVIIGLGEPIVANPLAIHRESCVVHVDPGTSIQAALDGAPEGGVVCLGAGVWTEHLTITKPVRLQGQGAGHTVLRAEEAGVPVIRISSDEEGAEIYVGHLAIGGGWGEQGVGILGEGRARIKVEACLLVENEGGAWFGGSTEASVKSSRIVRNGTGIVALQYSRVEVERSLVWGNRFDGVWLWGLAHARIVDSIVANNAEGVVLWGVARAAVRRTIIATNTNGGLVLRDAAQLIATENRIVGNGRYGVGVYTQPCADTDEGFFGHIVGAGNVIMGPRAAAVDSGGAVCPAVLAFLMTDAGGELNWNR